MASENSEHPVSQVDGFVEQAKKRGVYTPTQASNLKFALGLVLTQKGAESSNLPIRVVREEASGLLDAYGGSTKASPGTIRSYKSRVSKVLDDYVDWNGGDFMKWKEKLESKRTSSRRKRAKSTDTPAETLPQVAEDGTRHELRVPGDRLAYLVLPDPFTKRDLKAIWAQLEALRAFLDAQCDVDEEAPEP